MKNELEYDMLGDAVSDNSGANQLKRKLDADSPLEILSDGVSTGRAPMHDETDDEGSSDEREEDCGCDGCDEEDPMAELQESVRQDCPNENSTLDDPVKEATQDPAEDVETKKKQRKTSSNSKPSARLAELARPRQLHDSENEIVFEKPKPLRKKTNQRKSKPSLLLRLRPTNLNEAWEEFVASDYSEPPRFTYAYPDEDVENLFEANSNVCFQLLPEAERIMQKVHGSYGGPDKFLELICGEEKISPGEMQNRVVQYLRDQGIEEKVKVRFSDGMLSAANVAQAGDGMYVVNLSGGPVSSTMVQGICDHEVGTHLLRMMNDETQVWHGKRDRYKLTNPWTTEEGFATLNTYMSMPSKLLYSQAQRYYAVCKGAQMGFVELFRDIRKHISDPRRCWQMCCRIKRGLVDTSRPGAFYLDQAYFKGAVEILRHLNEIDFGRLYGGQIALEDLDKVQFLLRKECVRLPIFLNDAEKLKSYMSYCRNMLRENEITAAIERVCKPMFVRSTHDFFKQKSKIEVRMASATFTAGEIPKTCNMQRLAELARVKELVRPASPQKHSEDLRSNRVQSEPPRGRVFDVMRIASMAVPRHLRQEEGRRSAGQEVLKLRSLDMGRIQDLAKPKERHAEENLAAVTVSCGIRVDRELDKARLLQLSLPRPVRCDSDAPSKVSRKRADSATVPRQPRKKNRKKKRSSHSSGVNAQPATIDAESSSDGEDVSDEAYCVPPPPPSEPEPPGSERPVVMARSTELVGPRGGCEDNSKFHCCPGGQARKMHRSKLRLLALVQEKQQQELDAFQNASATWAPVSASQAGGFLGFGIDPESNNDNNALNPERVPKLTSSSSRRRRQPPAPRISTKQLRDEGVNMHIEPIWQAVPIKTMQLNLGF